jgi:hypothetical protein
VDERAGSEGSPDDAWDEIILDEAFILASPVVELSAEQRSRINERRARAAELQQRLLQQRGDDLQFAPDVEEPEGRRKRPLRAWISAVVIVAMLAGVAYWVATPGSSTTPPRGFGGLQGADAIDFSIASVNSNRPSPSPEEKATPLGTPPSPVAQGRYAFVSGGEDHPVAYDPCRPIHYVVNSRTAPPDGARLLREAIEKVSAATGLVFIADGATDENPSSTRAPFQKGRYGDRWAPVLVAWTDPSQEPSLTGDVVGQGGSIPVSPGEHALTVFVTGVVSLDGPQITGDVLPRSPATARAIIQHELGHLVGLDHVDDTAELMNPTMSELTDWGPGDLQGLARLGKGTCYPDL